MNIVRISVSLDDSVNFPDSNISLFIDKQKELFLSFGINDSSLIEDVNVLVETKKRYR